MTERIIRTIRDEGQSADVCSLSETKKDSKMKSRGGDGAWGTASYFSVTTARRVAASTVNSGSDGMMTRCPKIPIYQSRTLFRIGPHST